ncbi:MAG: hypothetical protein RR740_00275 [Pseudomonas sp.]
MGRKNVHHTAVVSKKKPPMLRSGEPSTLENWREIARLAFGDDSTPVKYLDSEIKVHGPKFPVFSSEASQNLLLATLQDHPELFKG